MLKVLIIRSQFHDFARRTTEGHKPALSGIQGTGTQWYGCTVGVGVLRK